MTRSNQQSHAGARPILAAALLAAAWLPRDATAGPLTLDGFFSGRLSATGAVANLRDGSTRGFTIAMVGHWSGAQGTFTEDVAYADGEKEHKVWRFEKVEPGRYVGRRADVTGVAQIVEDDQGIAMTYRADTKVPAGLSLNLSFADRFTRTGPETVTVRSDVTYFFVPAATITLTITRVKSK